jgi:hypothetical protein
VTVERRADSSEDGAIGKFRLTRTGDLTQALTVMYQLDGTAVNGTDYRPRTGSYSGPRKLDHE